MGEVAGPVPGQVLHKMGAVAPVDFALNGDRVIGLDGQTRPAHGFEQAGKIAAGVDDPFGAAGLQTRDEVLQLERDGRVFKLREERSIEIR